MPYFCDFIGCYVISGAQSVDFIGQNNLTVAVAYATFER